MANYVFCLAHFCEIHGPSTIICTKKQDLDPESTASTVDVCESCALQLPEGASSLTTTLSERESSASEGTNGNNSALGSSLAGDSASPENYVSTRYPLSQIIYASVKKLVMKCLSVEAAADPLKVMFFGDATSGFCLSKVFRINDVNARGGERKYALLMISDSEMHLLHNWDTVSSYIGEIIALIQSLVESRVEDASSASVDNEQYLRRSKNVPKSLVQLTGDAQIFVKFHLWGIELLRDMV